MYEGSRCLSLGEARLAGATCDYLFCYLYLLKILWSLMFSSRSAFSVNALTSLPHNFLVLGLGGHDKTSGVEEMTAVGYIQAFLLLNIITEIKLYAVFLIKGSSIRSYMFPFKDLCLL